MMYTQWICIEMLWTQMHQSTAGGRACCLDHWGSTLAFDLIHYSIVVHRFC